MSTEANPYISDEEIRTPPIGMEWVTKQEAASYFVKSEKTLESWEKEKDERRKKIHDKRKGSDGRVYYLIAERKPCEPATEAAAELIPALSVEEFYEMKARLSVSEERLKEKDAIIEDLRSHVRSENLRAEMASAQLMNANAALQRREGKPSEVVQKPWWRIFG